MKNIHDHHFKQLLAERSFFEAFMKVYLPIELIDQIDWPSVSLYKMGGIHHEKNTQKTFESDAIYLVKIRKKNNFIWLHVEHQSTPDKLMGLRILTYQTAELLAYAQQNPQKKLPAILTFIYHQGKKRWPYSLEIYDLFANSDLAKQYFAKPILIDLPAIPDNELQQHPQIGSIEMALKCVRQKNFTGKLRMVLTALRSADDKSREIVLQYIVNFIDIPRHAFINTAMECLPNDKETVMNVAEQWKAEGMQQGMQQGMQEGAARERLDIARNLLANGLSDALIAKATGLSLADILKLKEETRH